MRRERELELELAFPGEDAGISSLSLPHGAQPQGAAGVPWQGTQQPSPQQPWAVPEAGGEGGQQRQRGDV